MCKTKFLPRVLTPVKVGQAWQNSNLILFSQKQFIYKILIEYLKRLQRKVQKTKFEQRAITPVKVSQAWPNSNLICIMSWQIYAPNFKSISGAAVAEWLSSWLAEQEDRGSIPGIATWIFRDWLSPASKSRYSWNTAESDVNPPYNQYNQSSQYLKQWQRKVRKT